MTDTTALSPEQAARAEALRVAAGLLRTGNPLAGALAEYRTPSDLTDLAQYIITGADTPAAYRQVEPDQIHMKPDNREHECSCGWYVRDGLTLADHFWDVNAARSAAHVNRKAPDDD